MRIRALRRHLLLAAAVLPPLALAVPLSPALAQSAPAPGTESAPAPASPDPSASRAHPEDSGTPIVVVGRIIAGPRDPIYAPVTLQGDTLLRNTQPQIGQMLERLPGVSASGFAPGASRPVLRGFDGPRVQVLLDGLGSLDTSSVSADHAVSLDPLDVERVDVLHGPRVLLYASDPSGGVVNAIDKRIARRVPDDRIALDAIASYGTAADAVTTGAAVDVRLAPRFVAHLDAGYSHSDNLSVGGYVLSPGLRAQVLADADTLRGAGDIAGADALVGQADARGTLRNNQAESWSYGGGLAFIDDGGTIGVSVSRIGTDYGIPPRPGIADTDPVSIGLRQTRADLRAGLDLTGFLERIELRGAYGDYHHTEFDGGVPATLFANTALETRLEAVQARHGAWSGTSGVQFGSQRLSVTGDETLLPDTLTDHFAAFTLQRLALGTVDFEVAGRYEHTSVAIKPVGLAPGFDQWSGVAGAAWHPTEAISMSLDVSRGERAPTGEELFIDGVHDATQSYERGNPAFSTERSRGIEGGVHYNTRSLVLALTAYATDFADFITSVPTGGLIAGYPVYQFIQTRARFRGFEAEGSATLAEWGERNLKLDAAADYTRANLPGIGPVPRIPPLRVRGGLEYGSPALSLRGEVEWNAHQDRITQNEYPVAAFTLVNASATWHPLGPDGLLTLIVSGDNLLDVDARRAASETRDFVPIAGRDIKLTARVSL